VKIKEPFEPKKNPTGIHKFVSRRQKKKKQKKSAKLFTWENPFGGWGDDPKNSWKKNTKEQKTQKQRRLKETVKQFGPPEQCRV